MSLRDWGPSNRGKLEQWLTTKPVLPPANKVARIWGELSARATRRGRPRPRNDTWVAACCLAYQLPLATLNLKDFKDFSEYEGLRLITS